MSRLESILVLAAVTLVACNASGPSSQPTHHQSTPPRSQLPASTISALRVHDGTGKTGPFRLGTLAHFAIDTSYQGAPGTHAVRIDVQAPNGMLYAQLANSLKADSGGRGIVREAMQVAGTPIEHFQMIGTWSFALVVDGGQLAAASVDVAD